MPRSALEILKELRNTDLPNERFQELIAELRAKIQEDLLWPEGFKRAAKEMFGAKAADPRENIHGALDRRVQHAMKCWRGWFGDLNPAQSRYAAEVLTHTLRAGGGNRPVTLNALEAVVHNDRVHQGFKSRASYGSSEHSE